jgi:transcriptional regulator with XRE-family HTH domain
MATGKRIRYYREKLGWTLERLEEKSGVAVGSISALENRDSARSKFFSAIATALGLTVEQLEDEEHDWLDQHITTTPGQALATGNEFPSHPVAQAQMTKSMALTDKAASLGPKEAMQGLAELVRALHPALANAGRDALRQWVEGTQDAEQAATTLEALTHTSENMKLVESRAHSPLVANGTR